MENLLNADEVAAILKISRRKFESMIKEGVAPVFMRLGGIRRWRKQDISSWADDQILRSGKERKVLNHKQDNGPSALKNQRVDHAYPEEGQLLTICAGEVI